MPRHKGFWTRPRVDLLLKQQNEIGRTFLETCIVQLYAWQTEDERFVGATHYKNGKGFSCAFDKKGSRIAEGIISRARKGWPAGHRIIDAEYDDALRIAKSHSAQFVKLMNKLQEEHDNNTKETAFAVEDIIWQRTTV